MTFSTQFNDDAAHINESLIKRTPIEYMAQDFGMCSPSRHFDDNYGKRFRKGHTKVMHD